MTTAYDLRARSTAARMLATIGGGGKGQTVTLTAKVVAGYIPGSGSPTEAAPAVQTGSGVVDTYKGFQIDASRIRAGDIKLLLSPGLSDLIQGRTQEVGIGDPGNLHRVLKCQEESGPGPLLGLHVQKILSLVRGRPLGHLIRRVPGQDLGQRTLAGTVGSHDRMHLAPVHAERDAVEDLLLARLGVEVVDL